MGDVAPEPAASRAEAGTPSSRTEHRALRLSLCLLTWNEIDGCESDLPAIPWNEFEEVYAVDAGSTDGTVEYLIRNGITVHKQPLPGYNQAYICAFDKCTTDALVIFHPKASIDPGEIKKFRPLLEQGCDLVIASRMIHGARNEEDNRLLRPRKWFVLGLAVISAVIWRRKGAMIRDVLHGFRAMRRESFFAIEPLPRGLSIDLEMVVRCYRRRLRVVEFPIVERTRGWGATHFKAFPTGKAMLRYVLHELRRSA
jgi:glycosyltransferase involved in cell wall biosynthesis